MDKKQILQLPSMPMLGSSYPRGPYRFVDREYLNITYESDAEAVRRALPEPLEPAGNLVTYEFMKMPDSSGFGDYTESGVVIAATLNGEEVNFISQMYLDNEPPISAGREIWGFPKKYGNPTLAIAHDTLTGRLEYAGERVALGTMTYKHENLIKNGPDQKPDFSVIQKKLGKKTCMLKLIPSVDGGMDVCQLVSYSMMEISVKGAWGGPARLHLVPHVNAPVADLPVKKIIGGSHFIADMTLPYGKVEIDYLKG